jgi:hypothetical protein
MALQEAAEKRAQIENTLSNILKVYEQTQDSLVANIK